MVLILGEHLLYCFQDRHDTMYNDVQLPTREEEVKLYEIGFPYMSNWFSNSQSLYQTFLLLSFLLHNSNVLRTF